MIDPFRLDGRRILVTGASSDIGRAISAACADAGATVIATGRRQERLSRTMEEIQSGESKHQSIVADLTVAADLDRVVADAGAIDGCVHSAAITGPMLARSMTMRHLQERFDANFFAPMLLIRQLLSKALLNDGGAIVFISSISAHVGTRGMSAYAATKASQLAAARCLALELGPRQVRVNTIAPAIVRTDVYDGLGEQWLSDQAERYPLGLGTPRDVALATQFLLSDASRWITGESLVLTGASSWT